MANYELCSVWSKMQYTLDHHRFCGVVVITSALHAEGREFEPRQNLSFVSAFSAAVYSCNFNGLSKPRQLQRHGIHANQVNETVDTYLRKSCVHILRMANGYRKTELDSYCPFLTIWHAMKTRILQRNEYWKIKWDKNRQGATGVEPVTSRSAVECSATELYPQRVHSLS